MEDGGDVSCSECLMKAFGDIRLAGYDAVLFRFIRDYCRLLCCCLAGDCCLKLLGARMHTIVKQAE